MKKLIYSLLLLVTLTSFSFSQTTTVTATVQYPDGQVFANGTVTAIFTPIPGGISQSGYLLNGVAFPYTVTGSMNGSGTFSIVLTDDTVVRPLGGKWNFILCSQASVSCSTSLQDVSGVTLDLSTRLNSTIAPLFISPASVPRLYADSEAATNTAGGLLYYNIPSAVLRCWNGSAWVNCGGGGGSPAFNAITGGTNNSAAMILGTGSSLDTSGSGIIKGFAAFRLLDNGFIADNFGQATCPANLATVFSSLGGNFNTISISNACGLDWSSASVTVPVGINLHITQGTSGSNAYYMHSNNILSGNNEVWCDKGALVQLAGGSNAALFTITGSNVKIHGCKFDGNQPGNLAACVNTFVCGHIFEILGAIDNIEIYDNIAQNMTSDFAFWHANGGAPPTNIKIHDNDITGCGRNCITGYDQSNGYYIDHNTFHSWFCNATINYEDAIFLFQSNTNAPYKHVRINDNVFLNQCNSTKFAVEFVVLNPTFPQPQIVEVAHNISDCNGSDGGCGFSGVVDDGVFDGNTVQNSGHTAATGGTWRAGFEISGQRNVISNNVIHTGSITVGDLNQIECTNHITIVGNYVNSTADFATGNPPAAIYLPGNSSCLDSDFTIEANDIGTEGGLGTSCQALWIGNSTIGGLSNVKAHGNHINTGSTNANCIGIRVSPKNGTSSTNIIVTHNDTRGIGTGYNDSGNDTTDLTLAWNDFHLSSTPIVRTGTGLGYFFSQNRPSVAFSLLPAAAAGNEGALQSIIDSTTLVFNATITGGSTGHVQAYSNGTNWTVH